MPEPIKIEFDHSLDDVMTEICDYLNLEVEDVKGKCRKTNIMFGRHMFNAMAFALRQKYMAAWTLEGIGEFVGKDHSSVIHSCKEISNMVDVGYRRREIFDITAIFGRHPDDLIYKPKNTSTYTDIEFFENGVRRYKFTTPSQARAITGISAETIIRSINRGSLLRSKYKVTANIH